MLACISGLAKSPRLDDRQQITGWPLLTTVQGTPFINMTCFVNSQLFKLTVSWRT